MEHTINLDYARKAEGIYYGDGAARLAENVACAVAKYKSAKGRANAAMKAAKEFEASLGGNADRECRAWEESKGYWRMSYESGPYSWAIVASEALAQMGILAEPHYSFDLCFYDAD